MSFADIKSARTRDPSFLECKLVPAEVWQDVTRHWAPVTCIVMTRRAATWPCGFYPALRLGGFSLQRKSHVTEGDLFVEYLLKSAPSLSADNGRKGWCSIYARAFKNSAARRTESNNANFSRTATSTAAMGHKSVIIRYGLNNLKEGFGLILPPINWGWMQQGAKRIRGKRS